MYTGTRLSDLELLYDYHKDASLAATGYLTMSFQAHRPEVAKKLRALSEASSVTQDMARKLIEEHGGSVVY